MDYRDMDLDCVIDAADKAEDALYKLSYELSFIDEELADSVNDARRMVSGVLRLYKSMRGNE